LQTDVVMEGVP